MTTQVSLYQNISILDFIGVKDDGHGGDNWSDVQSSSLTNTQPFYRLDALPVAQPTASSIRGDE